jgi:hypothetical protein
MRVRQHLESHVLALLRHRPEVHAPSAKRLAHLCQQQLGTQGLPAAWLTFWSLALHFFEDLRATPTRSLEMPEVSAASHVVSGLLLREHVAAHDTPFEDSLQVINHLLFLEQADVISQRLVSLLTEAVAAPARTVLSVLAEAHVEAQSMAKLAQDVALPAVHQVADSLATQLAHLGIKPAAIDLKVSLDGAEEVSRLLQHFAVGHVHKPKEAVLAALRG